ncbi:MAG: DNA polymerase III subunit delta, partial [Gammaproteobacteria bacterium]
MRARPEQLPRQLNEGLAPLYLLSGDEPLLLQEACDAVRKACTAAGITERERITIEKPDNWQQLLSSAANMSLFGDRKLIELQLPSGKPGREGGKALQDYLDIAGDDVLLIIAGKIDKASTNSKWFKALDKAGVIVQVWPISPGQLPGWLRQRGKQAGLTIDDEALALLQHQVEGNLLAAAQEIEKLKLLCEDGQVSAATVSASVGSSARYDVFGMVDASLSGRAEDALRMLNGLRGEGTASAVVLWALAREIQILLQLQDAKNRGQDPTSLYRSLRIWDSKARLLNQALARHDTQSLSKLNELASAADGSIKGFA